MSVLVAAAPRLVVSKGTFLEDLISSSVLLVTEDLSGILSLSQQTAADSNRLWAKFDGSCLLELRECLGISN